SQQMICPACGVDTPANGLPCRACGAPFGQTVVATAIIPPGADTTGLPPGAAFGPTAAHTSPIESTRVHTATGDGPLQVGQSFGPRYHIIRLLGAGGMGAGDQAWDAELNVAVPVKLIASG